MTATPIARYFPIEDGSDGGAPVSDVPDGVPEGVLGVL
jgi:hypothetical protein